jgi:hypothetical protein
VTVHGVIRLLALPLFFTISQETEMPRTRFPNTSEPPSKAERVRWKEFEIRKFENLRKLFPGDSKLYDLAIVRVRDEIERIQLSRIR